MNAFWALGGWSIHLTVENSTVDWHVLTLSWRQKSVCNTFLAFCERNIISAACYTSGILDAGKPVSAKVVAIIALLTAVWIDCKSGTVLVPDCSLYTTHIRKPIPTLTLRAYEGTVQQCCFLVINSTIIDWIQLSTNILTAIGDCAWYDKSRTASLAGYSTSLQSICG